MLVRDFVLQQQLSVIKLGPHGNLQELIEHFKKAETKGAKR